MLHWSWRGRGAQRMAFCHLLWASRSQRLFGARFSKRALCSARFNRADLSAAELPWPVPARLKQLEAQLAAIRRPYRIAHPGDRAPRSYCAIRCSPSFSSGRHSRSPKRPKELRTPHDHNQRVAWLRMLHWSTSETSAMRLSFGPTLAPDGANSGARLVRADLSLWTSAGGRRGDQPGPSRSHRRGDQAAGAGRVPEPDRREPPRPQAARRGRPGRVPRLPAATSARSQ